MGKIFGMKVPAKYNPSIAMMPEGKTKKRAIIEFDMEPGYERDIEIAKVEHDDKKELERAILYIDLKYKKISERDYQAKLIDLDYFDGVTKERAKLKFMKDFNEIDEVDYELENLKLDFHGDVDSFIYKKKRLQTLKNHNRLSDEEYEHRLNDITNEKDQLAHKIRNLEIKHDFGHIEPRQYRKEMATLNQEPWIEMVGWEFDKEQGGFALEFDWNGYFVKWLKEKFNFVGKSDSELVDQWITANIMDTQVIGDSQNAGERLARIYSDMHQGSSFPPSTRITEQNRRDDGTIEFS